MRYNSPSAAPRPASRSSRPAKPAKRASASVTRPAATTSTASIASTPAGVVRVPPARTVGRRQRRKARVTVPAAMRSSTGRLNSISPLSRRQVPRPEILAEAQQIAVRVLDHELALAELRIAAAVPALLQRQQ